MYNQIIMLKEEFKTKIINMLKKMGCKNIDFSNGQENKATVKFDCDILLSFTIDLQEWKYSGIQLNDNGHQKYKIEFSKK